MKKTITYRGATYKLAAKKKVDGSFSGAVNWLHDFVKKDPKAKKLGLHDADDVQDFFDYAYEEDTCAMTIIFELVRDKKKVTPRSVASEAKKAYLFAISPHDDALNFNNRKEIVSYLKSLASKFAEAVEKWCRENEEDVKNLTEA